jgi:dipeptidyl aminopeptidase/acylaminoacyl peptidase
MKRYWFLFILLLLVLFYGLAKHSWAVKVSDKPDALPSVTEAASETVVPGPTIEPMPTDEYPFITATPDVDLSDMEVIPLVVSSPDGKWLVERTVAFAKEDQPSSEDNVWRTFYVKMVVRSADGRFLWNIVDRWERETVDTAVPYPQWWSRDGRYLYYTYRLGGMCSPFQYTGSGLYRLNLEQGAVDEILPGGIRALFLSPDEQMIAWTWMGEIHLYDLVSGQERSAVIMPPVAPARIIWSPDGQTMALTLAHNACDRVDEADSTSILLVDVQTLAAQQVLWQDSRRLVAWEWPESGWLILRDPQGRRWLMDVASLALTLDEHAPTASVEPSDGGCGADVTETPTP